MNRLRKMWCAIFGHRPMEGSFYIYNNNATARCERCRYTMSHIGGRWVRL